METKGIDQLLAQLQATTALARGEAAKPAEGATNGADFAQTLQSMMGQVNTQQVDAEKMAQAFAAGDPQVNLHEVMSALQKANISFQAMVQVRNKLVTAYQDIMNTQV